MTASGLCSELYSRAELRDMAADGHPLAAIGAPVFRMDDGMWLPLTRVRPARFTTNCGTRILAAIGGQRWSDVFLR